MRIRVTSVKSLAKYKIYIAFNDGTQGTYDLGDCAGKGVFKSWDEDDNFNKVFINTQNGAITWPGDIDIDTLNAYLTIKNISSEEYFLSQKKYAQHL